MNVYITGGASKFCYEGSKRHRKYGPTIELANG